jgi:Tol biopolymer transport system component
LTRCAVPQRKCAFGEFAWSPNGKRFAFQRGYGVCCLPKGKRANVPLFVINADGSGEKRIPGCGLPWPSCDNFAWAPDNRRIAFTRRGSVYVVDTRGGRPVRITHSPLCCDGGPVWSPDGSAILLGTPQGIYRVDSDGTRLTKLADGKHPNWSPDGRHIAFEDPGNSISTMDADGSNVAQLFSAGNGPKGTSPQFPAWSPDGSRIAFEKTPDATPGKPGGFEAEIWTMQADGTKPRRLYRSGVGIDGPAIPIWAPNGKLIAFAGAAGNGVYLIDARGETRRRLLTPDAAGFAWQSIPRPSR